MAPRPLRRLLLTPLLLLLAYFLSIPVLFDNGQCARSCRMTFGNGTVQSHGLPNERIEGNWPLANRLSFTDACECYENVDVGKRVDLGVIRRKFTAAADGYPYIWQDPRVCGSDSKVYANKQEARRAGVEPLHCGPYCGACSTKHDIQRYGEIGEHINRVVGPCIVAYLFLGKTVDLACARSRLRFTDDCNTCWVLDHECLAAHCFNECIFGGLQPWLTALGLAEAKKKTVTGNQACISCMEQRCSVSFINSCGTNRRTAGISTDIVRDPREHCDLS